MTAMIGNGLDDVSVRDEAGGTWTPIRKSPFAPLMPRRSSPVTFVVALLFLTALALFTVGPLLAGLFFLTFGAVGGLVLSMRKR